MTREELKAHCLKQIEGCEMWARYKGEEPHGKIYEEHKLILELLEQEPTYCPKFRNQQEKHRVFHTVTAVEKFFCVIGNDDAIDDISILKDMVRKIEVEE